jgi:2-polyprenyl-3-methyl-5-hydroxy-6-metoxy-1,4-benzoquinol methylase
MNDHSPSKFRFLAKTAGFVLCRPKLRRNVRDVTQEYSQGWSQYRQFLDRAQSLNEWMRVPGVEDQPAFFNVEGNLRYGSFDSAQFYRGELLRILNEYFPAAKTVTEFGCGVGRNLLYLKTQQPLLRVQGYELCQPGVGVAREAAAKFNVDIKYEQLDYLNDPKDKYVHPEADVAFTMFSLEQLPDRCKEALDNILSSVRMGSIHIEPVPENYPWTFRGALGRIDHWKVGYLSGFERAVRSLKRIDIEVCPLKSAHNPLMFPSAYVLRKRGA